MAEARPRRPAWAERALDALPILAILAMAAGFQATLRRGLDRSDLPGPGGVKVLTALATGDHDRDGLTRLAALLTDGLGPLAATELVVTVGAVAAVAGAMLCGAALGNRPAALLAGVLAATFGQGAFAAVVLGPDAPAQGLVWLGVGLSWTAARRGGLYLPLAAIGVAVAAAGTQVKINAAPALALLAIAPLLVPARQPLRLAGLIGMLLLGGAGVWAYLPDDPTQQAGAPPDLSLAAVQHGLSNILTLPDRQHPAGTPLVQLGLLGLVGAALPGRRWLARLATGALGVAAAALAAATVGDLLRPRYLLATALPFVALAGTLASGVAVLGPRRLPRAAAWLVLASAVTAPILFDSLAWLQAWSDKRVALVGTRPDALPAPPLGWQYRYARMSQLAVTDTSDLGAAPLVALATDAPAGGVATVPLRDAREFHLSAAAALAGRDWRILEARKCCSGPTDATCAARVVAALDQAGARLVLPRPIERQMRVPRPHQEWWALLRDAAEDRGGLEAQDPWWLVREPTASGGRLPCQAPVAPKAPGRPRPR